MRLRILAIGGYAKFKGISRYIWKDAVLFIKSIVHAGILFLDKPKGV